MSEYDVSIDAPIKSEAEKRGWTREQAVAYGRRLGEQTADERGEVGQTRADRIKRAMAYAAWEYDGKPASSEAQHKEFGVGQSIAIGSLERASSPRLLRKS